VSADSTRVWFDGQFYLQPGDGGSTPTADEVCALVGGPAIHLAEIDGVFALTCYDPQKSELTLANDRLGFRPLYYAETREWFAYAAEVKALLAILDKQPDLDEISLRQFLGFGHMLGDRTWWKSIQLLPPAIVWRVSPNGHQKRHYWTFGDIKREPAPEREVHEEWARLWAQAVRQRTRPGTMPLLLSGGLDSRLLLAELRKQGTDVIGITFGDPDSADMKIARQCSRVAGIRHRPLPLTSENWWQGREDATWQTDGLVNLLDLHAIIAREEMHAGSCLSQSNLAGDTLFGGSQLDENASAHWQRHPEKLLERAYHDNPLFGRDEVVSVSMTDSSLYLEGASSDCFVFRQRQRRLILYGLLQLASHCEVVFPGVSLHLVRLILGSVDDAQRREGHFYCRFLVSYYPSYFADIPWAHTGRGLAEGLMVRARRRVASGLAPMFGARGEAHDGGFANYSKFMQVSHTRERLSRGPLVLDEYIGGAAREAISRSHLRETDGPYELGAYALAAILTLEIYLRQVHGMASLMGEA
jgi:hypothetical protein